jgi:nucleoside phosphorylase
MRSPTNTATVVLLTALDLEYAAVRVRLDGWKEYLHRAGTRFEQAPLAATGWSIVIAGAARGNHAAAILTERAITTFDPYAVLFVGVAGALQDDLRLGDVVVGTKVYAYHGGIDDDAGFRCRPDAWTAPHELDQMARRVADAGHWTQYLGPDAAGRPLAIHFRPIAAGDVVLNSRTTPLARQLRRNYSDAAAIEMESAGAAHAGHLNQARPVLAIRGISDRADGRKYDTDAEGWQPIAAANAAAFALGLTFQIATGPGNDQLQSDSGVKRVSKAHYPSRPKRASNVLNQGSISINVAGRFTNKNSVIAGTGAAVNHTTKTRSYPTFAALVAGFILLLAGTISIIALL